MDSGTTATPTMATPASPMTTTPVEQGPTSPTMPTEAHTLQGKEGAFQLRATDFQSSEVPHYFLTSGRKWLVCIDGSAESKLGLFHALDLMNAKEDSLILVHAIKKSRSLASRLSHWRGQSSQAEPGEGVVTSPEQQQQQQQQQLQQPSEEQEPEPDAIKRGKGYLAHAGNLVKQWSDEVKWVTRCLEAKDPREALCELARDEKVDYIVMGSRGQNPIRSLFMGSVSSYVSSHAPCPVIVIRETEEERREKKAAEQEERKAAASARTEKRKKLRKKKRDEKKAQGPVEATTQLPQSPLQQPDALQQQMLMQQQLLQQPLEPTFQQQQMGAQHMMQQPLESTFQQQVLQQPLEPTFQQQPQQLVSGVATAETAKMMAPPQPEIMGPAGTSAASLGGAGERTIPVMEK